MLNINSDFLILISSECSVDGSDSPQDSEEHHVLISSFRSHVLKLKVAKKADKMGLDLLADDEAPGIWNSITRYNFFYGRKHCNHNFYDSFTHAKDSLRIP